MAMIDSLSERDVMILLAFQAELEHNPDYARQVGAAFEKAGYVTLHDGQATLTPAGCALFEEERLRAQTTADFVTGERVEYSRWSSDGHGRYSHRWLPGTVESVTPDFVKVRLDDDSLQAALPGSVRHLS